MGTSSRRPRGHDRIAAAKAARARAERRRQQRPYVLGALAVVVVVALAIALLVKSSNDASTTASTSDTTATTTPVPFTYGTADCLTSPGPTPQLDFSGSGGFADCLQPGSAYVAHFDTTAGAIEVALDTTSTPGTANNFIQLAEHGYYDRTTLFRTDPSIGIIQGGSPHSNDASDPGPGYTIDDEGGPFTYHPGQIVMARSSGANTASAQFFFTVTDAVSALDGQGTYVVFGNVTSGMDVLQKVLASNVDSGGSLGGSPNPPVTINSVTINVASLVK